MKEIMNKFEWTVGEIMRTSSGINELDQYANEHFVEVVLLQGYKIRTSVVNKQQL